MERFSFRRFVWAQVAFVGVLAVGTIGFRLILGEGWTASLYRAVVTTTLTGLDTAPQGTAGQVISIALLVSGVAVFLYLAGAVVELITRGIIQDVFGERRRKRAIEELWDHTIICGFGRVGRRMAAEFSRSPTSCSSRRSPTTSTSCRTAGGDDLRFEEIEVKRECPSCGRSIRDLRVRDTTGAMIIAIRKGDRRFDTTPSPDAVLEAGDVLIGVGTPDEIQRLEGLFAPGATVAG